MHFEGLLQFDDDGRLYIDHVCESCMKFPLEDLNEPCLECGYMRSKLIQLEKYMNRANKALDLMATAIKEDDQDDEIDVREAFLHLKSIKLGGSDMDTMVLVDIDQTDEIRRMADLAEHMVRVIIYPTNMRHIEGDDYEVEFIIEGGD
jgi:hypothetical protein